MRISLKEKLHVQVPVRLEGIVQPGATLLVTRESLASSGTGTRLSVLSAEP